MTSMNRLNIYSFLKNRIGVLLASLVAPIGTLSLLSQFGIVAAEPGLGDCSMPDKKAVSFFELIESPKGELFLEREAKAVFSRTFLEHQDPGEVANLVKSAKRTYGLDGSERPLSLRLAAKPATIFEKGADRVEVQILAHTARGKIDQRVSLVCEKGAWRVTSLSYGPPPNSRGDFEERLLTK